MPDCHGPDRRRRQQMTTKILAMIDNHWRPEALNHPLTHALKVIIIPQLDNSGEFVTRQAGHDIPAAKHTLDT